jgi:hypothetical protein
VTGVSTVHPACCNAVAYPAATPLVVESLATNTVTPACDAVVDVDVAAACEVVVVVAPLEGRVEVVVVVVTEERLPDWMITTPSTTAATITAIARPKTM